MSVYKAINRVQAALTKTGITKDRKNQQQGYNFRGIDDVYNVLSPLLAEHGLCILPRMIARQIVERQTQKGGVLFYVTVEAEFDFVCAEDGTSHTVRTFGEAMDSGDKATNKAMSAAYKYAAFQAFAIPTEGDNDADAHTHQIVPSRHSPVPDIHLPQERKEAMEDMTTDIVIAFEEGRELDCIELYYHQITDNDEKTYVWKLLAPHSKIRAFLKANKPEGK